MTALSLQTLKGSLNKEQFLAHADLWKTLLSDQELTELVLHFAAATPTVQPKVEKVSKVAKQQPKVVEPTIDLTYIPGVRRAWVVQDGNVVTKALKRVYFKVNDLHREDGTYAFGQGKVAKTTTDKKAMMSWLTSNAANGTFVVVFKPRSERWNAYQAVAKADATHAFDFTSNVIVAL